MRDGPRNHRVVHAPFDVGGNSYYLARAERRLGFDARTLVYYRQWFGYPTDQSLGMKPAANPLVWPQWHLAMAQVALNADVLHFNFGSSFLTDITRQRIYADLPLWKRLGIATFVTFQGCDSRISQYSQEHFPINACAACRSQPFCASTYDHFRRECLSQAGRHFDGIFALNPDLLHNIPEGQFLPYSNCNLNEWRPPQGYDWFHAGPVRLVHAPTWRDIKGSEHVIRAVEELKNEGENVEMVLVEKIPHNQVRAIYETADVLIDQVLVGWYGGLAVELMALGKPVVAYIRANDLKFVPERMRDELPVTSADPHNLKEVLRPLIRDAHLRRQLGERSRRFVENWHHPRVVAAMTTKAYRAALDRRPPIRSKAQRVQVAVRAALPLVQQVGRLYRQLLPFKHVLQRALLYSCSVLFWLCLPLVRLRSWWRTRWGRPSTVWGTTPIVTLPKLAACDRLLGNRSESVVWTTYYITQAFDRVLKGSVDFLCKWAGWLLPVYYRLTFLRALFKYDVFHYFFDAGFLERNGRIGVSQMELKWLRRAGKRVYLYAYGADIRTRDATLALGKYNCCTHCDKPGVHCICSDAENAQRMAMYKSYGAHLVSMGDMMAYVPGAKNLNYWPFDTAHTPFAGVNWDGQRPLTILHVPNHEWAKGSRYLKQALENLAARGIRFNYVQVSGKSNTEILRLMSEADIIADQFLIGWHGYTALEALALGKISLCYIRDRSMLLAPEECPIISTNPDNLEEVLTRLAHADPAYLQELGEAGRRYVDRNFSSAAMAQRLGEHYLETGNFPGRMQRRLRQAMANLPAPPPPLVVQPLEVEPTPLRKSA